MKVTTVPNFHSTNGDAVTEKANMKHRDTLPLLHVNGNGLVRSDELDSGEVTSSPNVKRYDDPTIQH